jgi:hypothetical protein
VELFVDSQGRQPLRRWLQSLDFEKRASVIAAIETHLTELGPRICETEQGKELGEGLFEFLIRVDQPPARKGTAPGAEAVVSLFCHARGDRIVLLGASDSKAPSGGWNGEHEIELARKRLRSLELADEREKLGGRRRG